jgi:hypothetical protein
MLLLLTDDLRPLMLSGSVEQSALNEMFFDFQLIAGGGRLAGSGLTLFRGLTRTYITGRAFKTNEKSTGVSTILLLWIAIEELDSPTVNARRLNQTLASTNTQQNTRHIVHTSSLSQPRTLQPTTRRQQPQALRSFPSVKTTHCTAPRSSFNGVQCSINFSNPMYGRAHSLSSRLTGFPNFNPLLMVLLKSQLSEPLPWLARKRKTSTPMAGVEKVLLLL